MKENFEVSVVTYGFLKRFPTGLRHIFYFIKLIPSVFCSDFVIALDTFSVAVPAVFVSHLFRKKIIIRVGGDFLWEQYVQRTKETVLLSEFYTQKRKFSKKEKYILYLTSYVFSGASAIVLAPIGRKIFSKKLTVWICRK